MKRKWALCPVNIWDVETMERWLEDEAARGWRLDGSRQWSGWRVRFLRTEPAACRVRMQPVGFISQEAWRERIETCREMGWDCGASFRWQIDMAAFYCDDPDAPELDTDMEVWAMVWRKAFAWGLWKSIGLGILGLALLASVLLLGWEIAVTEPLLLLAIQTLGGAGLTLWAALSVPKLLRLRRQASAGLREPPRGNWRRSARWGRAFAAVLVLGVLLIPLGNTFAQMEQAKARDGALPALAAEALTSGDFDMDRRAGGLASGYLRITWREGETTYTAACWQVRWEPLAEIIRDLQMAETGNAWETEAGMDHLAERQTRAAMVLRGDTVAYAEAAGPGADDGTVADYAMQMADCAERWKGP